MSTIAVPREIMPGETRCAQHPETIAKLLKLNANVLVEKNAGKKSFLSDAAFEEAGASIIDDAFDAANIIFKVQPPTPAEVDRMQMQATYIGPLYPHRHEDMVAAMLKKKMTVFALEQLPRIARAQSMDILSSMSNLAGYKSVTIAADLLPTIFPMLTTAAGTIQPAKVMVIGAGVAGLQAIATARRLGAVVIGFDTRPATEEQIKSLGAEFVSMEVHHDTEDTGGYATEQSKDFYLAEQQILMDYVKQADIVITTALIPRKKPPLLITKEMVSIMKPGAVIVDLAASEGGNCEVSEPDKVVRVDDVSVVGYTNLPARLPRVASLLFSRNLYHFYSYITRNPDLDMSDALIQDTLIMREGQMNVR